MLLGAPATPGAAQPPPPEPITLDVYQSPTPGQLVFHAMFVSPADLRDQSLVIFPGPDGNLVGQLEPIDQAQPGQRVPEHPFLMTNYSGMGDILVVIQDQGRVLQDFLLSDGMSTSWEPPAGPPSPSPTRGPGPASPTPSPSRAAPATPPPTAPRPPAPATPAGPPRASDGQHLGTQPAQVQAAFQAHHGDAAPVRWVAEHEAELARPAP